MHFNIPTSNTGRAGHQRVQSARRPSPPRARSPHAHAHPPTLALVQEPLGEVHAGLGGDDAAGGALLKDGAHAARDLRGAWG